MSAINNYKRDTILKRTAKTREGTKKAKQHDEANLDTPKHTCQRVKNSPTVLILKKIRPIKKFKKKNQEFPLVEK